MPSGGARVKSGPAPDPNALNRERDKGEWVTLPAEGRVGPAPAWPLTKPTARESELWVELWAKPQAIMWERLGQRHEVALFVRKLRITESPKAPGNSFTPVRQLADSLGLTTPGMRANRWKIAPPATESKGVPEPVVPFRPRVVADDVEGA